MILLSIMSPHGWKIDSKKRFNLPSMWAPLSSERTLDTRWRGKHKLMTTMMSYEHGEEREVHHGSSPSSLGL